MYVCVWSLIFFFLKIWIFNLFLELSGIHVIYGPKLKQNTKGVQVKHNVQIIVNIE